MPGVTAPHGWADAGLAALPRILLKTRCAGGGFDGDANAVLQTVQIIVNGGDVGHGPFDSRGIRCATQVAHAPAEP